MNPIYFKSIGNSNREKQEEHDKEYLPNRQPIECNKTNTTIDAQNLPKNKLEHVEQEIDEEQMKNKLKEKEKALIFDTTNSKDNLQTKLEMNCSSTMVATGHDYIKIPESLNWVPQANARKRICELYFTKERELGSGVSSHVSCVYFHGQQQQKFALKAIRRDNKWGDVLFSTEARILGHIQNPGVVKLMNCFLDEEYFYLLIEMGHIDLFNRIKSNKRLSEPVCKKIITKILNTLAYLHSKNVVHRDLKPENIVFTVNDPDQPKFIDFGDAILVGHDDCYTEFVGTPCYLAPERLREHKGWELKSSDVWTVGVMAYEMVTGKRCFYGKNHREIFHRIRKGEWKWPKDFTPSRACQEFVETLLDSNPSTRPSAQRSLQHPWLLTSEPQGPLPSLFSRYSNCSNSSALSNSSNLSYSSSQKSTSVQLTISDVYSEGQCAPIFKNLASNMKSTKLKNLIVRNQLKKMSDIEKKDICDTFHELDRNHDGFIDVSDLLNGFTNEGMNANEAAALARTIILELDRTNKGKINIEDFLISHLSYRLSNNDKTLKRLFDQISNSSITSNSQLSSSSSSSLVDSNWVTATNLLENLKISTDEISTIISEYDHDGDGKLSFTEFKEAMHTPILENSPLSLLDIPSNGTFPSIQEPRVSTIDEQCETPY